MHSVVRAPPARDAAATVVWTYRIDTRGTSPDTLSIEAQFAPGSSDFLEADDDAAPFVNTLQVERNGNWLAAPASDEGTWRAPCHAAGCRVRYDFDLRKAALRIDAVDTAMTAGGLIVAPPSTWLVRPREPPQTQTPALRVEVQVVPPLDFATGVREAPGGSPAQFQENVSDLSESSFGVFGPFRRATIRDGKARVDVALAPRDLPLTPAEAEAWLQTAVAGIARYYGTFPVARTLVIVIPGKHADTEGETLGGGGPSVAIRTGLGLTAARTRDDWVVVHELLHVTLPSLRRDHLWLSEGIATYVEPVIRARGGQVTAARFWADLVKGLPQGLPAPGDLGLDRTHTWGRTYWGGALFCFVSDLRIREATHGARSFDDALRGIVRTGSNVSDTWDIRHFMEVGDRATGTTVLTDLYRAWGLAPESVDLADLWSKLGVRLEAGGAVFDETAPWAAVRRAITDPNADIDERHPKG
jgi:hypothetical protein